jgi:hypothetical protein
VLENATGLRREDGFFFIQFVILQFHQGIRITPIAKPEVGHFDPAKVLWAIHRGATCNADVTHQWKLLAADADEDRETIALRPKLEKLLDAA